MTIYGLAQDDHVTAGHGDYYSTTAIKKLGFYGSDGFPPFFTSLEAAEKFMLDHRTEQLKVVSLVLIEDAI